MASHGSGSNCIRQLEANGYSGVGYFYRSLHSWLDDYFQPLQERIPAFLVRHNRSGPAKKLVEAHWQETDLYNRCSAYYSYGFYMARKDTRLTSGGPEAF